MLQPRRELDLALEALALTTAPASSGGSTLTTTVRPSARFVGDEHARHAAAAELALEVVTIAKHACSWSANSVTKVRLTRCLAER